MASWFDHENVDDSFENFVHSVDHIKILKVPKGRDGMGKREIDYFKKELYREKFEDLMYVRDEDGGKFYILVNERRGNIEDLIIFGEGENEVIFIELIGHMNSRDVSRFCKKIQMHEI